jgi:hypothetical protein
MDKMSFVEKAPPYYALALALALANQDADQTVTLQTLEASFGPRDEVAFAVGALVRAGMRILVQAGVAEIITEDFGPRLYGRTKELTESWILEGGGQQIPLFRQYAKIRSVDWLHQAIKDVNPYHRMAACSAECNP